MDAVSRSEGPIGGIDKVTGRRRVVVVDDTNVVRHRRSFSGFRGRKTMGHKTIVLAGVELDHEFEGRKETGRVFLFCIPNREKATIQPLLKRYIAPGSLVWTDKHGSFDDLGEVVDGKHETVDHDAGQFSRIRGMLPWRNFIKTKGKWRDVPKDARQHLKVIASKRFLKRRLTKKDRKLLRKLSASTTKKKKAQKNHGPAGVVISSNAAEGLIGRTKRFIRGSHAQCKDQQYYALPLAEYAWQIPSPNSFAAVALAVLLKGPYSAWRFHR